MSNGTESATETLRNGSLIEIAVPLRLCNFLIG